MAQGSFFPSWGVVSGPLMEKHGVLRKKGANEHLCFYSCWVLYCWMLMGDQSGSLFCETFVEVLSTYCLRWKGNKRFFWQQLLKENRKNCRLRHVHLLKMYTQKKRLRHKQWREKLISHTVSHNGKPLVWYPCGTLPPHCQWRQEETSHIRPQREESRFFLAGK